MTSVKNTLSRRTVLKGAAALGVGALAAPTVLRAQPAAVKIGLLQPMSGFLAGDGQLASIGAKVAVEEVNAAGGIKSLGGAPIELIIGDSQSNAEAGAQATETLNDEGVSIITGGFASGISTTATQAAARYDLPFIVDTAVSDAITGRGLSNTFRFGPSFSIATTIALANLQRLNDAAEDKAKTVALVHEDGLFGSGLAGLMQEKLPDMGFEIVEVISHPTPARDMSNVVLRLRSLNPDLIIPSHYYNEFVLFARTLQQQRVKPKGIYAIFGGAASSYRFVNEYPEAAEGVMDCNHWGMPDHPATAKLMQAVKDEGTFYAYNTPTNYALIHVVAQALEKAGSSDRAALTETLKTQDFDPTVMPYGIVKFDETGQNQNALPLNTQVQNGDIKVIYPEDYAQAEPVFPVN
ncbi:MAG: branched-chain amino acid ABC transporter substrate-binding protein [Rhizobiaceae bacterium MnEN-MB40S]|nr:MAG: branched-chain amino acid ABC transporter substrate-binding protein [Rhizobiaceae bacterium MnEN-MB40S]